MILFTIDGAPVPKGSMKSIGRGRLVASNAKLLRPWLEGARQVIEREMRYREMIPAQEPVAVDIEWRVRRPKGVTRRYPSVRPDSDKYLRALLDAMTGHVYVDDGQVVAFSGMKRYCEPGERPSTRVMVDRL